MEYKQPYPFDKLNVDFVSKKLAKALIVKFLKRERIFYEMITECMLYHGFNRVEDVLNNMTLGNPLLYECLYYASNTFPWEGAKRYHIGNKDKYWLKLMIKWENLVGHHIMVH